VGAEVEVDRNLMELTRFHQIEEITPEVVERMFVNAVERDRRAADRDRDRGGARRLRDRSHVVAVAGVHECRTAGSARRSHRARSGDERFRFW
jgi:hypothetical protein